MGEYIEGQTLADYRGARVLSLQEAMPILKQMAAALDVAHQQKIIHRDVKPANVLIKPDGTIKLTDFGIIKLLEATGTTHPSTDGIESIDDGYARCHDINGFRCAASP